MGTIRLSEQYVWANFEYIYLSELLASFTIRWSKLFYPKVHRVQSNLDYSKCQGPQESFRIIGSSNDPNQEFFRYFRKSSDAFIERHCFASLQLKLVFSVK